MALTFIYGNSGSGKSRYIYKKIADMAGEAPYQRYFVVVPEQFTMRTQRLLVDASARQVILNADVVSFERLALRVFDELGVSRSVMEETGKSLVLKRLVEKNSRNLTLLRGSLAKMGYIGELKSVICELMQYGISPDGLEDFIGGLREGSALACKLRDILRVYRAFEDYLGEGYVTAEKVPDLLTEVAGESRLLRGAVILFDGYTGFTPPQMKLIRRLMSVVSDIYVTVTLDVREPLCADARMQDLFYMSHRMVSVLSSAAREVSAEIAEPVKIEAGRRSRFGKNPVLFHLEQNLFRTRSHAFLGDPGERLSMYSLANPPAELRFAAERIASLVRDAGYRYRDFAVVSSHPEDYVPYADGIFSLFDIPVFIDRRQTVLYHPLVELVLSALEMARTDLSCESVFSCLRTDLCGFSRAEVDLLENYCVEKGIRGAAKWKKRFVSLPKKHGRIPQKEEDRREALASLNRLRRRFWEQAGPLVTALLGEDLTVRERTEALYAFLFSLSAEDQLRKKQTEFEERGEEFLAASCRQMYKIVIDLLDKTVDLLGEERLSQADYADVLEAGFASASVGSIPQGNDCVILGDIERTRLDGVKILIFLGVNDGQIPKRAERGGILSPHDREVMEEREMELAPGEREQVFLQRFYLYLTLTKPSDALYMTCARMDAEGKAIRPSYLIGTVRKLFPALELSEVGAGRYLPPVTPKSGVESYLSGLRLADGGDILPEWKALHGWFDKSPEWSPVAHRLFEAHFRTYEGEYLEADLARALYGAVMTNSVTRLEMFGRCAFAHFLEYGLKLGERPVLEFTAPDMGTMFHMVLQRYGKRLEQVSDWDSVAQQQQDELLKKAMEDAVSELSDESVFSSFRGACVLEQIRRVMKRTVWAVTEQIRRGDFRPAGYEVGFSETREISPGLLSRTVGSVDRMDTYEADGRVFVRVIDYKSGDSKFQLLPFWHGRQIQLVLYLREALEMLKKKHPGREVVPAGIFYYHLDDPMAEGDLRTQEEIEGEIFSRLRLCGLVSEEPGVYSAMDRELSGKKKSDVIPLALKTDGSFSGRGTSAAPPEDFFSLTEFCGHLIGEAAARITGGEIGVAPFRSGNATGCDYCAYKSVCGFDLRIPGHGYRMEDNLDEEELWARIRKIRGGDE